MSWLSRIKLITLHQTSDIPYVILDDGVHLCFSNLYDQSRDKANHSISFTANKSDLIRQSTNYVRFLEFPKIIPFSSVAACDDAIIEGRFIKQSSVSTTEQQEIVIVKSGCLQHIEDNSFQNLIDVIVASDEAFLLTGEHSSPHARLLDDLVTTIYHKQDWGRTCVTIADKMSQRQDRKYCWTKSVPDINVKCYGLESAHDMEQIQDTLDFIGITSGVTWEE